MKKIALFALLALLGVLLLLSCSKRDENGPSRTYVLVHGAWQAPYAWQYVAAGLQKSGNKVVVVELPGHGTNQTAPQTLSLDVYRDKVLEAMANVEGKVILVGHSLGGMVISSVAEKAPSKVQKLVYIGAFLPVSGQSLLDLAQTDADSWLSKALVPSADQLTLDVIHDSVTDIFVQDGSANVKSLVLGNYRPEPAIPFTNKVALTDASYGSIQKAYIRTLQDHVISPGLQDRMIGAAGIGSVYSINSSHSPFLSKPDSVVTLLIQAAR
jgi:pimeloyl-ACP methyl ester carboxylesterase